MSTLNPISCGINVVEFKKRYGESFSESYVAITTLQDEKEIEKHLKAENYTSNIVVMSKEQYKTIFDPLFKNISKCNDEIRKFLNEEKPKWICSDSDCYQYVKKLSEYKYELVQIVDVSCDDEDFYYLCHDVIDIEQYLKYDLKTMINILHSYDYGYTKKYFDTKPTIEDWENVLNHLKFIYGKDALQIVAECLFEVKPSFSIKIYEGSEEECIEQLNLIISE